MFCVECGKEPEKLYDSLCQGCYGKRLQAQIDEHLDIDVCTSCWAARQGNRWKERPDMHSIMLEKVDSGITISPEVSRYSFRVEFVEEDPRNYLARIKVDLIADDIEIQRELTTRIIFKKVQCKICSRIHGNYYEAILQVRASRKEMREDQKNLVKDMVKREVEERRSGDRNIFITSSEEIHGGLDFYLSDNGVAKRLSKEISNVFGGKVTSSSSLAGRKDGRDIYKMTYSVRLPPYERGDFVNLEDGLYRVMEIGTSGGNVTLIHVESGRKTSMERWLLEDIDVMGGDSMIKEAVVVSETEREMKVLDPDTYLTVTLVKPQGFTREGDSVKIVKVDDRLLLVQESGD